jgi:ribosomal protein S18 acetylase RimI-like enzyme
MPVTVSPASPAEWAAAGRVLFVATSDPGRTTARFLELIASREIDPAGLFVARSGGRICGAMLAQRFAGRQGAVWPPAADVTDRPAVEDRLMATAVGWVWAGGAKVVQALLEPGDPGGPALERFGFHHTTALAFLNRDISEQDNFPVDSLGLSLTVEPYSAGNAATFSDTLVASYDGTLDCPELNDTRTGDEIIAGYRDASPSGNREWSLVSRRGKAVAVLMLSAPDRGAWALTYLGITPAARGVGLGRAITRLAIRRAAVACAPGLTLNVDVRNDPALRLYLGEHFSEYARREVWLWVPDQSAEPVR